MRILSFILLGSFVFGLTACTDPAQESAVTGYVEARYRYLAADQPGRLRIEPVREGDRVQVGDLLFALDDELQQAQLARAEAQVAQAAAGVDDITAGARPEEIKALRAQLAEAEARFGQARIERDRHRPLVANGIEPQAVADRVETEYRAAKAHLQAVQEQLNIARLGGREGAVSAARAGLEAARATVDAARYQLDQRTINAPVAGTIKEIYHRPGELVGPGQPVLSLLPEDGMVVRFFVTQKELPRYKMGAKVLIIPDGLASPLIGEIIYISDRAEFTPPIIYSADTRASLVFMIEAKPQNTEGLTPGLPVDVRLAGEAN